MALGLCCECLPESFSVVFLPSPSCALPCPSQSRGHRVAPERRQACQWVTGLPAVSHKALLKQETSSLLFPGDENWTRLSCKGGLLNMTASLIRKGSKQESEKMLQSSRATGVPFPVLTFPRCSSESYVQTLPGRAPPNSKDHGKLPCSSSDSQA